MASPLLDTAGGATAAGPETTHGRSFADGGFFDDKLATVNRALLCVFRVGHSGFQRSFHQSGGLARNQRHGIQRRDGGFALDEARDFTCLEGANPHILGNGDFFHVYCAC